MPLIQGSGVPYREDVSNMEGHSAMSVILEVRDLKTYFHTDAGLVKAVDGVSYHIDEREIVRRAGR